MDPHGGLIEGEFIVIDTEIVAGMFGWTLKEHPNPPAPNITVFKNPTG